MNPLGKLGSPFGKQFLGVIQPNDAALGIQNYRRGHHGTKQRAAPGFVQTRNTSPSKPPRRSLETGRAESRHNRVVEPEF
jgi:hypothetical protein